MKHNHPQWDIKEPGVLIIGDMASEYTLLRVEGYPFVEKAERLRTVLNRHDPLVAACRAALAYICGGGQDGTLGQHHDNWLPTMLRDALARVDKGGGMW